MKYWSGNILIINYIIILCIFLALSYIINNQSTDLNSINMQDTTAERYKYIVASTCAICWKYILLKMSIAQSISPLICK